MFEPIFPSPIIPICIDFREIEDLVTKEALGLDRLVWVKGRVVVERCNVLPVASKMTSMRDW
jgi:hypothetical protein